MATDHTAQTPQARLPHWMCEPCSQAYAFRRDDYHERCTDDTCACARNGHRGWFHWRNGWFFRRHPDGFVDIERRQGSRDDAAVVVADRIPDAEWESIVQSTSPLLRQSEPPTQGCVCPCCDHSEDSDCSCECHADPDACAFRVAAPVTAALTGASEAPPTQEEQK